MARTNPKQAEFRNKLSEILTEIKAVSKFRVKTIKIDNTLSLNDIHNTINFKSCNWKVLSAFQTLLKNQSI